jgi:prepilin-type N-terminal cleavage/methylation domain-containing protein
MEKKVRIANKGFTLMEVIITIALLAIVIVPFSNLVLNSFLITNNAKIKQEATNIAQKYMEKIKADTNIDFDNISDGLETLSEASYPTSSENGFTIKYFITRDENYRVITPVVGVDINVYDYRFEISQQPNGVIVYDKNNWINAEEKIIPNFKITNNPTNITYKINDIEKTINKTKAENENVIVRVDINRNFSDGLPANSPLNNPDNTLIVTAENKCSGSFIFYFVKGANLQTDVKCEIVNLGGSIIKYDNLKNANIGSSSGPKSRLYKIKVEVEKKGQKVVNESYRTFY